MSEVPVWACEFLPATEPGSAPLNALTVGAKFNLKCHGDLPVQWDTTPPALVFAKPEEQYTLALLKVVQQDPNDVQYLVTGYKAGNHTPEFVRFLQAQGTPSEKGFEASKLKWEIKSVLDPKQPAQPYGPFGPWSLSMPMWIWLALAVTLAAVFSLVFYKLRKHSQRRRMLEELQRHKTALAPLHQFYRDARQLRRRLHNVKDPAEVKAIGDDLDREFRLYVLRRFQIPALDWSNRAILEDLRRRHRPTYRVAAESLKKALRELGKLRASQKVNLQDVEQLHRMSLDAAEKLDEVRS